ncbi:bifunctional glutamate/proline--tRNA ligase-like [Littorina saxatilis]|uniref:bifunctional glutamate/proline--tRNA ligase-like n=1 Tax=Littorina saxatilis TaxID=31220 RepID=UPI0038B4E87B
MSHVLTPQDEQPPQQVGSAAVNDLDNQIRAQGEQVRQLKTNKAPKDEQPPQQVGSAAVNDLDNQIRAQGEQVRQLKTNKAPKEEVTAAVQTLLSLKKQDKETTGKDWTPPTPGSAPAQTPPTASAGGDLDAKIKEQGDKVRQVKANKAPKGQIQYLVKWSGYSNKSAASTRRSRQRQRQTEPSQRKRMHSAQGT